MSKDLVLSKALEIMLKEVELNLCLYFVSRLTVKGLQMYFLLSVCVGRMKLYIVHDVITYNGDQ